MVGVMYRKNPMRTKIETMLDQNHLAETVAQPASKIHLFWIYSGPLATALDAATWLKTAQELRNSGWDVTLVAVGPAGYQQIRGVEVLCIPRPEIYLLRQAIYHLRVLALILKHWS